ncbi:MAG TPA: hypothetical protein VN131_07000, partial [Mobilitalea sp.]|nr:hypothetical protein [Mobilitalea sp.]
DQPVPMVQTYTGFMPGAFISDGKDYLASLDSDTRDYVLKHTDASRTRQDIIDCIDKLHNR